MQRKGRAWTVDQKKIFLLSYFVMNSILSVDSGLAVSQIVLLLRERRDTKDTAETEASFAKVFCPR